MKNTLVVRMTMGPQKEDERVEAKVHHMKTSREIPTLGTLKPAQGEDRRVEIVVETTTDEARDMRKTEDVRQIGGWRNAGEGRVATTFDICEKDIPQHCVGKIWAKTNIRAKEGVALYVNAQQWEELAPLLATCPHQEAVIRERPRWALIEVKPGQGDEMVKQLYQWRKNGAITTGIGYRTWTSRGGEVSITAGKIGLEELVTLHVFDAHPSFTESCCKAFLEALKIKHPVIEVTENFSKEVIPKQGDDEEQTKYECARIVSMQIPRTAASKIEAVTREFDWEGDLIRVTPLRKPAVEEKEAGGDAPEPMQIEEPQKHTQPKPKRKVGPFKGEISQGTDEKVTGGQKKSGREGGREGREEDEVDESESDSTEDEAMLDAEREKVKPEELKQGGIVRAPQISSGGKTIQKPQRRGSNCL